MSEKKLTIKDIFTGNFTREFLRKYTLILVVNFIVWILISTMFYENYDWTRMDVSFLGITSRNPGWIFWAIAMASTGVLQIPIMRYLRKNLIAVSEKGLKYSLIWFYIACIGLIGLGVIPLNTEYSIFLDMHYLNAVFAFGGMYMGVLILLYLMFRNKDIQKRTFIPYILIFSGIILFIISQAIRLSLNLPVRETGFWFLSISAWEWIILVAIFGIIIYLIFTLKPGDVKK